MTSALTSSVTQLPDHETRPQLALGTVQFGLAYGIAGPDEAVPEDEVRAILEDASARGVVMLDTAAAYGDIEERLASLCAGLPFQCISKIPAIPDDLSPQAATAYALQSAEQSLRRLDSSLRGLMLHRGADLKGARGEMLGPALRSWASEHGVTFGSSCYAPNEAAELAREQGIVLTQLPGNAFDQRIASAAAALNGLEVHLRSAFLQGLLLMPRKMAATRLPQADVALSCWHDFCHRKGLSPLEAALGIVKGFTAVSTVLVGVETLEQWQEIAEAWDRAEVLRAPELAITAPDVIDPIL